MREDEQGNNNMYMKIQHSNLTCAPPEGTDLQETNVYTMDIAIVALGAFWLSMRLCIKDLLYCMKKCLKYSYVVRNCLMLSYV